jgi:hypothetical protein
MPLETEVVEILFEGLDQKTDGKVLKAGKLTRAVNVEFDKAGALNKRRGFLRYQFSGAGQIGALGETMETQAIRVAVYRDELLVFGVRWLWSVASKTSSLDGSRAAVKRGPLSPGNLRVLDVATIPEGGG